MGGVVCGVDWAVVIGDNCASAIPPLDIPTPTFLVDFGACGACGDGELAANLICLGDIGSGPTTLLPGTVLGVRGSAGILSSTVADGVGASACVTWGLDCAPNNLDGFDGD
jgi:hypothetical protein